MGPMPDESSAPPPPSWIEDAVKKLLTGHATFVAFTPDYAGIPGILTGGRAHRDQIQALTSRFTAAAMAAGHAHDGVVYQLSHEDQLLLLGPGVIEAYALERPRDAEIPYTTPVDTKERLARTSYIAVTLEGLGYHGPLDWDMLQLYKEHLGVSDQRLRNSVAARLAAIWPRLERVTQQIASTSAKDHPAAVELRRALRNFSRLELRSSDDDSWPGYVMGLLEQHVASLERYVARAAISRGIGRAI